MEETKGRKLTIDDLNMLNGCSNSNEQFFSYKIVNNQKKYSHTQKIKP